MTVKQLKEENAVVEIYHARKFKGLDELMNRKEFEETGGNFSEMVDNSGGFTMVDIELKDGTKLYGKYNVPRGLQFARKIGVKAAIGRAMKEVQSTPTSSTRI